MADEALSGGRVWWQTAVVYELLVPSFQDSNGDGWGDLPGILRRLDDLQWLGIDAIWLSPITASPLYDIGYDVADYRAVEPRFGTLDDFDALLAAAHQREMRVIIDFVPNHTSVEHPWFQQARRSRDDAHRDWYLWADPGPGGGPPNNWINRFGHSAWTFDEATGQYYLGSFAPQQPDLNWRNPQVRAALADVLHFWLRRGVDGVRVDALAHLIKDQRLRNNPPSLTYSEAEEPSNRLAMIYHQNQPELLECIAEMRAVFDQYDDRVMLGEVYQSAEQITAYQRAGAHLLLTTAMLQTDFEAVHLRNAIDMAEGRTAVGAWPSHSSGNHDLPRLVNRVGEENLRLAALLHLSVRGTPTMYYGEELGLLDIDVPPEQMRDPSGKADARYGRDGHRSPMPWDASPGAGFSEAPPWLPIDEATRARHWQAQRQDPDSLLNFYRRLLEFRRDEPALLTGEYAPLEAPEPLLAFFRGGPPAPLLIAANLSDAEQPLDLAAAGCPQTSGQIVFSTGPRQAAAGAAPVDSEADSEKKPSSAETFVQAVVTLRPREAVVIRLQESES